MPSMEQEVFYDTLFRNKKKRGGYRLVEPPVPPLEALVADTHAHLDMLVDTPLALARCGVHRVGFVCSMVDVHEDADTSYDKMSIWLDAAKKLIPTIEERTFEICALEGDVSEGNRGSEPSAIPAVRLAIGCHPHNAKHYDDALEKLLIKKLHDPLTCAIGEVGLDYHYDYSPRDEQREAFRRQIQVAHETELPLVLHLREAHVDALSILDKEGFPQAGTLLHCFNLDYETLVPWLERDCFVAFGGPLTFKKNNATREAAAKVPLERLLTETDAPFMTPEPMRGMVCGPEHTIFTAQRLADVRNCPPGNERETFLSALYCNALTLLNRKPKPWQMGS